MFKTTLCTHGEETYAQHFAVVSSVCVKENQEKGKSVSNLFKVEEHVRQSDIRFKLSPLTRPLNIPEER